MNLVPGYPYGSECYLKRSLNLGEQHDTAIYSSMFMQPADIIALLLLGTSYILDLNQCQKVA